MDNLADPADKNIDTWGKRSFADFKKFVDVTLDLPIFLPAPQGWQIYIPVTKTQSCNYNLAKKRTSWCTAKPNQREFEEYFLDTNVTLIYCFREADHGFWAIASHPKIPDQFFNSQQKPALSQATWDRETGLNSAKIIQSALSHAGVEPARAAAKLTSIPHLIKQLKSPDPALERRILVSKNAQSAVAYALTVKPRGRGWPEAEPVIAQDAYQAYWYARNVLDGPFPAAEPVIAQDAERAYWYALYVLNDPKPNSWGKRYLAQHK